MLGVLNVDPGENIVHLLTGALLEPHRSYVRQPGKAGYVIEKALSVANVSVFDLLFIYFAVPVPVQY
ncbi:MAG: hypothetical protein AVDCRST_MAG28-3217 [uncultured Rubrobacteraceae bacterium]|uniref:Uncharacterized protein n=1 Tax=uncultured Rubrobacteraceae bacterium TaxID=349277 RepID=A0A6J4RAW0_9ACTN|nr:MAG: hypothetical protein AVDCRST_MAG28-3217 [uncultured Rubrobacteraceae bacterium]